MKRKCAICKKQAKWPAGMKAICSPECGAKLALSLLEKEKKKQDKEFRKETARMKREFREDDNKWWKKKATTELHAWIRNVRDKDDPCISCGRYDHEINDAFICGGKWDAGHYLSKGGFEELRFEPLNIHKQCKSCNAGSSKYARKDKTVRDEYRVRLINKIGIKQVEWLEGPHDPKRLRAADYKLIHEKYKMLNKQKEIDFK